MAVEAKIVTLTDNEDKPIAPRTDASAVYYDNTRTVRDVLNENASTEDINALYSFINDKADKEHTHTIADIISGALPIANGGTGAVTAAGAIANLGALGIVDARSSDYDMDAVLTGGEHFKIYKTNSSTLGTPAAYGASSSSSATIISYSSSTSYGFQLAFVSGSRAMFQRALNNGNIGTWTRVLTNVLLSSDYGTQLPSAGTQGRIFFKKA